MGSPQGPRCAFHNSSTRVSLLSQTSDLPTHSQSLAVHATYCQRSTCGKTKMDTSHTHSNFICSFTPSLHFEKEIQETEKQRRAELDKL